MIQNIMKNQVVFIHAAVTGEMITLVERTLNQIYDFS